MQDLGEELVAEPRPLSRRVRLSAGGLLMVLLVLSLLTGGTRAPGCPQPVEGPPARPWLPADDPLVRDLHFTALDRPSTSDDRPPGDILPADVRRSGRRLGSTAGIAVYLADGAGFACLGVDGHRAGYESSTVCLLNTTIANQGLSASVSSTDGQGAVLVVALPDGADLLTTPATDRLADYPNVAVLRPRQERVYLHEPGRPPIALSPDTSTLTSCP